MKRIVSLVITASLLSFAWSCQQEQLEPAVSQNEGTIEISIGLADALQTKSDHDGSAVTTVWYEVYDNKSEERIFPKADSDRTFPAEADAGATVTGPDENRLTLTDGKATLQFQTLKNRSYKILFWAMSGTDAPYTWSTLDNISMNYDKSGKRDAFFGSIEVLGQNTSALSVTLRRPFALINFGAAKDEIELYNDAPCIRTVIGDEVTYHPYSGAEIEFENVATAFSVTSGAPVADCEEELTQAYASLVLNPGDMEGQGYLSIKNEGDTEATDYVYMTASYILAPSEGTTIDMTATFKCLEDGTAETSFTYPLATVPVQANHRTNILGRIFTGSGQLSVSKMVGWEDYNKELWNGETQVITPAEDNVYVVMTAEQLAWVAQQVNTGSDTFFGKTVRLGADIDLAGSLWTPIGDSGENSYTHNFQGTFDGDGKTIRNMKVDHPDAGGLFGHMVKGTVRDLTIDGFEIASDHYAGAIAGWIEQGGGNILVTGCKALNGKIEVSVITKDDGMHHDLGDKAGSIVGFGHKGTYTDNVAENVEIRGYRDLGGILGYAHEATVTGNSITNVTIKQNLDIDYKKTEENGDTPTTLGDYVGRISEADSVIENNTGTAGIYAPIEGYNTILKYLNTGEYHIFNLEGLKQLNQFFKDKYSANDTWDRSYNISADIDATGFTWESVWMNVGSNDNDGLILDGHGHTISNLTITGGGLLSGTPKGSNEGTTPGVVRDITIDGANVTGDHFTSVFWGQCYGDVMYENVVVRNSKIKGACNVGAFIGGTSIEDGGDIALTFRNCLVTGTTLEATGKDGQDPNGASGYVGRAYGATSITFEGTNNVSNSNITNQNQLVGGAYYGYTTWLDGGFASTGCSDTKTDWGGLVGVIADGLALNEGIYSVSNANGLAKVNEMMADQSMGKNAVIEITDDIDFTGKSWTPVDSHADKKFNISEIIGNNHTIKNLTINGQAMFTRFAGTGDVTIKNVTFENAVVTSSLLNTSILTVQTYQNILLDNVDVKNSTITGAYKVAPLIATVYNENKESTVTAKLKNCDISDVIVKATAYDFCTSGLVAFVYADDGERIEFENCSVTDVKLMAPDDKYKAHAAVYTTGSLSLFNEAEGVTVTNVTFEALE